jgi:copper chaperone CopZ
MTHTYSLSGLTCSGCVAKVKKELLRNPDITSVEVTLDPQVANISMSRHIGLDRLQQMLEGAGNYRIFERARNKMSLDKDENQSTVSSWFTTYKPLILIFVFITGVSLMISYDAQNFHWMRFMTAFMSAFFLVFSFFKFLDLKGFAGSYATYDLLAAKLPAYGLAYPFIELGLGLAYLTGFNLFYTNLATVIIMSFSSIGVIQSVLGKNKIQCACLGTVFNFPMSTVTIIEDLLMVGMAASMLILH